MISRTAALETLGLRSGAGRAEIDEAYRRLIKVHHPDRAGGNAGRAAEINHAYTLLRRESVPAAPRYARMPIPVRPPRRRRRSGIFPTLLIFALVCGGVAGLATLSTNDDLNHRLTSVRWAKLEPDDVRTSPLANFDSPLNEDVVDQAIADATKFRATRDTDDAAAYSRDCQKKLHADPNLVWFDACAAFDESMATLRDNDPGVQEGPFSDFQLMTRELSAARALTDDSLAADARLHQIRSQVEVALLPTMDAAAGQRP